AGRPDTVGPPARLGKLYDHWRPHRVGLSGAEMLRLVLRALGPIWPGRLSWDEVPLGDSGRHGAVPGDGIVPFHKLSQWLVYSLIEPLADAGLQVPGLDGSDGLATNRSGGLALECAAQPAPRRALALPPPSTREIVW